MPLLVVRHAHAGDRGAWSGEDRLRPLSDEGHRQARRLVEPLAALEPKRIFSSPAVRCRQTVEPLGTDIGLDVVDDDRLFEGSWGPVLANLLDELAGRTTVICTHGDVVPRILSELIDLGMTHDDDLRWPKASAWVIEHSRETGWGHATYLAPPPGRPHE